MSIESSSWSRISRSVTAEPHLVPLALDDPFRLQRGQELAEHPLLGIADPTAQLLPGDPGAQGILDVEGLEEGQRLGAQAIARVPMQVPLAIHREDAALVLEPVQELPEQRRPEGRPGAEIGDPRTRDSGRHLRLRHLEAETIYILREAVAEFHNPVMLYSIGKDSSAMLHIAQKAFAPAKPPFPLLHVDTTWKFREMIAFRDEMAARVGMDLLVHVNEEGLKRGISPVASGSALHTQIMKTEGLRQALDKWKFDVAFGGARRDEEKSRAKERIFSHRSATHGWDPRNQRPELWKSLIPG